MPANRLKSYLDSRHIRYELIPHAVSFTAQRTAAATHIPGREFAKTVVVRIGREYATAVIPAPCKIDLEHMAKEIGADSVKLVDEAEIRELFPDCEIGAMPSLGHLYGLKVFVAEPLTEDRTIAFASGKHTEAIRMRYSDFADCVHPRVLSADTVRWDGARH